MSDALVFDDVSYCYPGTKTAVISKFDAHFVPGERIGVYGANGTGKTTLLRLAAGLFVPTTGTILLGDRSLASARREVALVSADFDMFEYLTIEQNIRFFLEFYGRAIDTSRINALLTRYELLPLRTRIAATASRGMRRKVQLITALLQRPRVLVADEALDGLDEAARNNWLADLALFAEQGGISLWTLHDRSLINQIADRVIDLSAAPLDQPRSSDGAMPRSR